MVGKNVTFHSKLLLLTIYLISLPAEDFGVVEQLLFDQLFILFLQDQRLLNYSHYRTGR